MSIATQLPTSIHPIYNRSKLQLSTPMIEALQKKVKEWLWAGTTGGVVLGDSRVGKTRAIQFLKDQIVDRVGVHIPNHMMTVSKRDTATVASVYRNLCYSFNIPIKTRATADELCDQLLHFLFESAKSRGANSLILTIDEAQRLKPSQLVALAEIYDKLQICGIHVLTVLVANQFESNEIMDYVELPSQSFLKARFFLNFFQFEGICTHDELKQCLAQFDNLRFPEEFGPTYTEECLGPKYPSGWRLATISRLMWSVFQDLYGAKQKNVSWPMQYFVSTVCTLLLDYFPRFGVESEEDLEKMIENSIKSSGLLSHRINVVQQ